MRFLLSTVLLALLVVAIVNGQRGGFFDSLLDLLRGGNNNRNTNNNGVRNTGSGSSRYPLWLDTSDGRFAKFNGPVRGIPRDHGGGRFGAANCLLCPNGS